MSDQNQLPEITDEMRRLLQEVRKYALPPKEITFFSIVGMVGRYENPISDLLRFFMSPREGHDLAPPFLRAFFACIGKKDCSDLKFEDVNVMREVKTRDGKLIDLLISASDWVLLIENKIDHWPANPFDSYENDANDCYPSKTPYLAILSPDGEPVGRWPKWKSVSYQDYCRVLKSELLDHPLSKWKVFAEEFIVHIENLLYNPAMKLTSDQTAFIEVNLRDIPDLQRLYNRYIAELSAELADRVEKEYSGNHTFAFFDKGWLHCDTRVGSVRLQLRFFTPAHGPEVGNLGRSYQIMAWVAGLTEDQHQRAAKLFANYGDREGPGYWWGKSNFETRAEAVNGLCKLAKELFDLLKNEAPPSLPI